MRDLRLFIYLTYPNRVKGDLTTVPLYLHEEQEFDHRGLSNSDGKQESIGGN